jgi:hypothetical protein
MPRNALILGYQRSRDGNNCGAEARRETLGNGGTGCLQEIGGGATYSGGAWIQNGRSAIAAEDVNTECEATQRVDTVVLDDGTGYKLNGLEDGLIEELLDMLVNGTVKNDVPEAFAAFEVAK